MSNASEQTILIIDDLKENITRAKSYLHKKGYATKMALSGKEGLALCETQSFDLILLDIMMPEITGFDVIRSLAKLPLNANTPVIFITAYLGPDILTEAYQLGGKDYVTKPFHAMELTSKVQQQLNIKYISDENSALRKENQLLKSKLS